MPETKLVRDQYPYEQTWKQLTKKQQAEVTRRVNKKQVSIPMVLKDYDVVDHSAARIDTSTDQTGFIQGLVYAIAWIISAHGEEAIAMTT